jgi:hybrid cluster-associated redox disulfide protein
MSKNIIKNTNKTVKDSNKKELNKKNKESSTCQCHSCECELKPKPKKKKKFTKKSTISEVLQSNRDLKVVLEGFGMHCFGCPLSQMETLEEASNAHKIDLNFLLDKLNNFKK